MMIIQIALKTLLSHRKRSLVTFILTAVSTGLLIFSSAFMDGSHSTMIRNAVEVYPGYIQITHKGYRDSPGLENLIEPFAPIRQLAAETPGVAEVASRFETFVLFASREKAVGALFTGIEPEAEKRLSRLAASLVAGRYLRDTTAPELYIGKNLAEKLRVGVGDEVSFIGTGADYSFAADTLHIVGIFQTGLWEFDNASAFVPRKYFDFAMNSAGMATHLIVLPQNIDEAEPLAADIASRLPAEYECLSWQESMRALLQAMELDSVFGYITLGIIFVVIFFVIMIYTLLNVFTRVREIGMLRAIGTSPQQVFGMLLTESALLSLMGVILGAVLGGAVSYYFQLHPIAPSGYEEQFKQYGLVQAAIPAVFSVATIVRDMIIMLVLAVGSMLYPIVKVLRFNPVEAMRHV